MKNIRYIICGLCFLLVSCKEEDAELCADPAQRIYLRATVENGRTASRSPFEPAAPSEASPLKVAVWASTTANRYENSGKNGSVADGYVVALHTAANFTNGREQLLNDAVYPKPNDDGAAKASVYFVGLHPEAGWTDNAGIKAVKTFNGSEDVMFAPQESGVYGGNVGSSEWPTFKFRHLLTWLVVNIKADGEAVSEAWGKLKSLKLMCNAGNTVTVALDKEYSPVYNPGATENCVEFSSGVGATFDFYKTGTDEVFLNETDESTWYTIPFDERKEVAYVLCTPVVATAVVGNGDDDPTDEYTLIVETERRSVEVPVDLMDGINCFGGSTMNYKFILNLDFRMGNNIMLSSSVKEWEIGGITNGIVSPEEDAGANAG